MPMPLKAMMATKTRRNQYPKPMPLKAMMAKMKRPLKPD
jgi:hypothetical protein